MIEAKPLFLERMKLLLKDEEDFQDYLKIIRKPVRNIIRINLLKTSKQELMKRLKAKGWNVKETEYENALVIESNLSPGALGKSIEHQLGYYYVQELSSMMSPIALEPIQNEAVLDSCAAPGSKTTQISMLMNNRGTIIANDIKLDRIRALQTNLDRCGCTNAVVTRTNGINLCETLAKHRIFMDKILVDASCSGEGVIRSDPKILVMWNPNMLKKLSNEQKKLCSAALSCLKSEGILVYSTCTHAPEENELVVDYLLKNFNVKLEQVDLPIKTRPGILEWKGEKLSDEIKLCARIYPQDNDTEGFFVAKLRKL